MPDENALVIENGSFQIQGLKPNPASDYAVISFVSEVNNLLSLDVYDLSGRKIATLFSGNVVSGVTYTVDLDTKKLEDGVYTVRLFSLSEQKVQRLMVAR
jgi:hypothetical protein